MSNFGKLCIMTKAKSVYLPRYIQVLGQLHREILALGWGILSEIPLPCNVDTAYKNHFYQNLKSVSANAPMCLKISQGCRCASNYHGPTDVLL